jgi:hypothetical protein
LFGIESRANLLKKVDIVFGEWRTLSSLVNEGIEAKRMLGCRAAGGRRSLPLEFGDQSVTHWSSLCHIRSSLSQSAVITLARNCRLEIEFSRSDYAALRAFLGLTVVFRTLNSLRK